MVYNKALKRGTTMVRQKVLVHITTVPQTLSFLSGQLKYMKLKGYKTYVISSPGARLSEFSESEGINYIELKMSREIDIIKDLFSLIKLLIILFRLKPDIVHSHTPKASLISMISSWMLGIPQRIYHVHGLVFETSKGFKRKVLILTEYISCLLSTQIYSVSHSLKDQMLDNNLCKSDKVKVLLNGTVNGVDARYKFAPSKNNKEKGIELRRKFGVAKDDILIGFVGRLVNDKGIKDLIQAWRKLDSEYHNIKLMLVGSKGTGNSLEQNLIKDIENEENIHLVGSVEDVIPYYSAMDILVHPSYREGFGQVILEASSMKIPVVACKVTGCIDAVIDGKTGTLVPARNPEFLKSAIGKYIEDKELRIDHGLNGRMRALNEFNPQHMWEIIWREYESLLK